MLKETKFKKGDIVDFRLPTGEEVIAKIEAADATSISVTKPLLMHLAQQQDGTPAVGLAPFIFGIDETKPLTIETSKCLYVTLARKEAVDQYMNATSPIAQPKQEIIMP